MIGRPAFTRLRNYRSIMCRAVCSVYAPASDRSRTTVEFNSRAKDIDIVGWVIKLFRGPRRRVITTLMSRVAQGGQLFGTEWPGCFGEASAH